MNITSLALAAALAGIVGCAQTVSAQTQDQTGAAATDRARPDDNGSATTGVGHSGRHGNWRDDDNEDATDSGNPRRQWTDRAPMVMPMRPMQPQRRMMLRGAGAQFHFARGNARIDVTCSPQEDTQACVRAAGELIGKIAELHHGEKRDDMTGSAGNEHSGATEPDDDRDDQGAPGERM